MWVILAKIKKVARPIIPITANLRIKKIILLDVMKIFNRYFVKYIINPIIKVDIKIFLICISNGFRNCQNFRFFNPWIYWYKETKAAIDVAAAIPTCPNDFINIRLNVRLVKNTTKLYFTGVVVSPLAKKFGIRAFTIT